MATSFVLFFHRPNFDQKISQAARWGWWNAYGQHINDSTPTIKANLATMGEVDATSVEMRVSGVGLVPANYEPKSKVVTYAFTEKLLPKIYTVLLSARVKGRKVETRWNFIVDRE